MNLSRRDRGLVVATVVASAVYVVSAGDRFAVVLVLMAFLVLADFVSGWRRG